MPAAADKWALIRWKVAAQPEKCRTSFADDGDEQEEAGWGYGGGGGW